MSSAQPKVVVGSLVGAMVIHAFFSCASGSSDRAASASDDAAVTGSGGNPIGPAGPTGPSGPAGPTGPTGPQGVAGTPGAFAAGIAEKGGNNGTVSCATFCAGAEWGATGTCVGAKYLAGPATGTYLDCQTIPATTYAIDCWCSQF